MKAFSGIFHSTFCWAWARMFEYDLYPIYVLLLLTKFIHLRVFLLLSSLNDVSVDIVNNEGSFEFSRKAEFASPVHAHITLATDAEPVSSRLAQLLQY